MTVYTLTLTGAGGPLSWPLSRIECTRRLGESSWVTVEAPTWSAAMESALRAETDWIIEIDADAVAFLRATLTEIVPDRSPFSASFRLTGRIINPAFTAQTRVLTGVSHREDEDVRHTARAEVDPLMRPNDTVNDGVESWTAGLVQYRIAPHESWMQVTEAL